MKSLAYLVAGLLAMETAAIACSCLNTDDPVELARLGAEAAQDAVAVVEAEALTSFEQTRAGERMRVVRTLAGAAPGTFIVERGPHPGSASCDVLYKVGERVLVILYPSPGPTSGPPTFRTSGLCTVHLLDKPAFRDSLIRAMGGQSHSGERG